MCAGAKENASDHAPTWVDLGAPKKRNQPERPAPGGQATEARGRKRQAKATAARRPLFVVDGELFAHRAYHALPKTIRGSGEPARRDPRLCQFLLRCIRPNSRGRCLSAWDTFEGGDLSAEGFPPTRAAASSMMGGRSTGNPAGVHGSMRIRQREGGGITRLTIFSLPQSPQKSGGAERFWSRAAIAMGFNLPPPRRPSLSGAGRRDGAHRSCRGA